MDITEIIERLKNIAEHAVHRVGERPFIMSLDDGIAVHEAIELLTNSPEIPDSCNAETVEAIPVDWIVNFKNSTKAGALMEPREVIKFMLESWKEDRDAEVQNNRD